MSMDIMLRLLRRGLFRKSTVVEVTEPAALVATDRGKFTDPPQELWSRNSGYAQGDIKVPELTAWLRRCLGAGIQGALRDHYSQDELLRVLVTADQELLPDMMMIPWELLAAVDPNVALPGAGVSPVRVLHPELEGHATNLPGRPIKIGVLWANPRNDIPDLDGHLKDLQEIAEQHPLELELIGPVQFTDPSSVTAAVAGAAPEIIYHIGHAEQAPGQKAYLLIGPSGSPSQLNLNDFTTLLEGIGPPHLLVLNSCATVVGQELNPYLGAAITFANRIDAVVAMQTEVTVQAAKAFASAFFQALAANKGLAASMNDSRRAIQNSEPWERTTPSFTPFIPVLMQRTRLDHPVIVDVSGRELRRAIKTLEAAMGQVNRYLERDLDGVIAGLLDSTTPEHRVVVIYGSSGVGKTTSLQRAIRDRLNEQNMRLGKNYLYYSVRSENLFGDNDQRIYSMLLSMAQRFSPLTDDLTAQLKKSNQNSVAILAEWLDHQEKNGSRYWLCLDHVPPDLAAKVAAEQNPLRNGLLMLVSESLILDPATPVTEIRMERLNTNEIQRALGQTGAKQSAELVLDCTNGFPYLVAAYLHRPSSLPSAGEDVAKHFLETYEPQIPDSHLQVLRFAAICDEPIPGALMEKVFDARVVEALADEYNLVIRTGAGSYILPEVLREYVQSTVAELPGLLGQAFDAFVDVASAQERSQEETTYQAVTRWFREAFRQCAWKGRLEHQSGLLGAVSTLQSARQVAERLHERYLELAEIGAGKSLWEEYLELAGSLERYDDRDPDVRYAEFLMKVGEYEEAEIRLERATAGDDVDSTKLYALFLWSNLLKEIGRPRGPGPTRVELLQRALEVAGKLSVDTREATWLKQQIASLEHSLGNALGFGFGANVSESLKHLETAQKLFVDLNDPLQFRTISEQIEVKRYNQCLSATETEIAKRTLLDNLRSLVTRSLRYDAMLHFYELGRLEADPRQRAEYFQRAFDWAKGSYEPYNWHAAINWRIAQVESGTATFADVAPKLQEYAAMFHVSGNGTV